MRTILSYFVEILLECESLREKPLGLSAQWMIYQFTEASCVANRNHIWRVVTKSGQNLLFSPVFINVIIDDEAQTKSNEGFHLKNKSLSRLLCKECSFCHVSDWLFVPNKTHLDQIYNSSVAWLSWRLVIPPGSPQQSIPFSSFEEEQPGLLGRI